MITIAPHYMNVQNRRKFFDQYAKEQGFDPLIVENWYATNLQKLLSKKVCAFLSFFFFYKNVISINNILGG